MGANTFFGGVQPVYPAGVHLLEEELVGEGRRVRGCIKKNVQRFRIVGEIFPARDAVLSGCTNRRISFSRGFIGIAESGGVPPDSERNRGGRAGWNAARQDFEALANAQRWN